MALREILIELGVEIDKNSEKKANASIDTMIKGAKTLGRILAGGAIALGYKKIIDLASAAAENQSKFEAVFQEAAATTQTAIDDIAKRTKQSSLEIKEFAASIGALVKPSLGSGEAAGKMGASIAELALDIASFNDLKPEEALQKLRSGLIGSAEPLQSVGVDVRAAALDLDGLAKSLGKTAKELTEGEKVQARYNAIVRQLKSQGALGDAEKTADGFANAARALRGQLIELGTQLGTFFLKSANDSVISLRNVVITIKDFLKVNKEVIQLGIDRVFAVQAAVFGVLATAGKALIKVIKGVTAEMTSLEKGITGALVAFGALLLLFGLPVALLALIGAAIFFLIDDLIAMGAGGTSVVAGLISEFLLFKKELGSVGAAIKEIFFTSFSAIFGMSRETFNSMVNVIGFIVDLFESLIGVIGNILGTLLAFVSDVFTEGFEKAFSNMGDNIASTFTEFIEDMKKNLFRFLDLVDNVVGFFGFGNDEGDDEEEAKQARNATMSRLKDQGSLVPAAAAMASTPGGGTTSNAVNQSNNITVQVDATGNQNPQGVGKEVRKSVEGAVGGMLRQINRDLQVQAAT